MGVITITMHDDCIDNAAPILWSSDFFVSKRIVRHLNEHVQIQLSLVSTATNIAVQTACFWLIYRLYSWAMSHDSYDMTYIILLILYHLYYMTHWIWRCLGRESRVTLLKRYWQRNYVGAVLKQSNWSLTLRPSFPRLRFKSWPQRELITIFANGKNSEFVQHQGRLSLPNCYLLPFKRDYVTDDVINK